MSLSRIVCQSNQRMDETGPNSKKPMPEISRFFGIIVRMHYDDHRPPHVHAESREQAKIDLSDDLLMRAEAGEGMD